MIESTDEVSVFDPEPVKADGDKPPVQSDATNKVHRKKKKEQLNSEKEDGFVGELDSSADRKVEDTQSDRNDDSKTKSKTDKARRKAKKKTKSTASQPEPESTDANNTSKTQNSSKTKKSRSSRRRAKKNVSGTHLPVSALFSSGSNSGNGESSSASPSLSAEGLALLEGLQSRPEVKLRTGKIPMSELMGTHQYASRSSSAIGRSILERLGGNKVDPEAILEAAVRQMPQVPGFPSLRHRPDSGPFSSALRPELFKTTMEAYASAAMQCGSGFEGANRSVSRSSMRSKNGRGMSSGSVSPDQLMHWISFVPMYPLDKNDRSPNSRRPDMPAMKPQVPCPMTSGPSSYRTNSALNFSNNHGFRPQHQNSRMTTLSNASHSQQAQSSNQKTRKPYFMPHLSGESVSRGLAQGELIKGSLRVNQRNYEESYVDNPEGDDQLDLLILGVHDRNRALHGDVVVVRIKDRDHWVVRDNLYLAWRAGHLNVSHDDNGLPLTIPPVQPAASVETIEVAIGGIADLQVARSDLEKKVPISPERKYDRDQMLLIGAQLEVARKELLAGAEVPGPSGLNCKPKGEIQANISSLSIGKVEAEPTIGQPSPVRKNVSNNKRPQTQPPKRATYRVLADLPPDDWGMPNVCLQKTAEVVYICETKNCRAAMGQLKVMADGNRNCALFSPTDSRMPRMMIPADQLPAGFFERHQDFSKFLFAARLVDWQATAQFARGKLERSLGLAGDIDADTEGILFAYNIDAREFSTAALSSLPITESTQWTIDEKEFSYRKDLRDEIIFTIDPKTARDLDDALHIKRAENVDGCGKAGWEIGVHIADVTHFLTENTELDAWAANRGTSTYLVHKVIPMLPRILCEELCSLNSGVDRLAFSVIWQMDDDAKVYSEWFGRTIIRSKVKLAYEHAQEFIEDPKKEFDAENFPDICDDVKLSTIKEKVLQLDTMAKKIRAGRQENGALRLDQPKLKFCFDETTKMPNGVAVYEIKDANKLVEEFMLLANMAVARKIEEAFPKIALLRRHPDPRQKVMREMLELAEKIGFPLDGTSSDLLSKSLHKYQGDDEVMSAINQILNMLMMKPMQLAQYFCTGTMKSTSGYHHYALNVPLYTHFTSPIRRYADVMVHRLLSASLGYTPTPDKSIQEVERQAQHCNDKKNSAKLCSEASDDTFFGLFIKQCGPIEERGIVVNVLDHSFDVLVLKFGVVKRVYVNRLDMARDPVFREGPPPQLLLYWNSPSGRGNAAVEQTIQMCTVVDVVLSALPEPTKYQAVIKMNPNKETRTLLDLYKARSE